MISRRTPRFDDHETRADTGAFAHKYVHFANAPGSQTPPSRGTRISSLSPLLSLLRRTAPQSETNTACGPRTGTLLGAYEG
jgi:hypothetical protein